MTLSANDPTDHVEQLTALTLQLAERIAAETKAFEAKRPQDAAAGQGKTVELANLYRQECLRIRRDPQAIAGVAPEVRARLIDATQAFEAVLARQGRALSAARTITEGLVRAIAGEVAAARAPVAAYGPKAVSRVGDASAIAVNRRA